MKISKAKISTLILIISIISLVAISILSFLNVNDKNKQVAKIEEVNMTLVLMESASDVMHELQKERGRTAGFLSSKGYNFKKELPTQRKLTDDVFKTYVDFLEKERENIENEDVQAQIDVIRTHIDKVFNRARSLTDKLHSKNSDVIRIYSEAIGQILRLVDIVKPLSGFDRELYATMNAYKSMLEEKERTGITRAVFATIFGAGLVESEQIYLKARKLQDEIDLFSSEFDFYANDEQKKFKADTISGKSVDEVNRMKSFALDYRELPVLGIAPSYWFDKITSVINVQKKVEDKLAEDLISLGVDINDVVKAELIQVVIVSSLTIIILLFLVIVIIRSIVGGFEKAVTQIQRITTDIINGDLSARGNPENVNIDFKIITENINSLIEAFVDPLELMSENLSNIAQGKDSEEIINEYKGDFGTIVDSIIQLRHILNNFGSEIRNLVSSARQGNLSERADSNTMNGDWASLIEGVNDLADAILEPIGETVTALDRMANGDFKSKITSDFKGDHARLKDAINTTLDQMPFEEATSVLASMANGDFTMPMQKVYKGDSEEFKQNINVLAETMNSLINEINSAVNTTASSSVQLETTADTLATSIQELASQTDEVATAVEEMSSTITESAENIKTTNEAAQSNMDIASEGGKKVNETVEKMGQIGEVVSQSANNIEELGRSSKKIGEIINVIDEIADQTNLLALNAAIEAARAGEQGRGFAVVADEVRKLAERTGGATKEITGMVKEIQEQTSEAVDVMENGKLEVEKGITLAGTAGDSLEQIVDNAKSILERINFIADSSREQSATSEEISKNVSAIAEVTQDSANRVGDVSGLSGVLNQLTNDLSSLMSKFQTNNGDTHPQVTKLEGVESRYLGS